MAEQANSLEHLYRKLRTGNPKNPALSDLFKQLDLDVQRRVMADLDTVNHEADSMKDVSWAPKAKAQVSGRNQRVAHRTMMDKSRVDL